TAQLEETNTNITRALFNTLAYQVTNHESDLVRNIQVKIQLGDHTAHSTHFSLLGGETREVPVVIGGYADLADLSPLTTTLHIQPDTGEVARLIQHQEVDIAYGSGLTVSLQTQKLTRGGEGQVKFSVENKY
ncbi:MAG: hypothetical protein VSS75_015740, partial [Candidatus Parabeggiatoa sp.]|nr:hypothetical protein [Candidatus Parabeggiatoa sp.]